MIENPQTKRDATLQREADLEDRLENPDRRPVDLRVKRLRVVDHDQAFDSLIQTVDTRVVSIDAKLLEQGRNGRYQVQHLRTLKEFMNHPQVKRRVRAAYTSRELKEWGERMVDVRGPRGGSLSLTKLRESNCDFTLGAYDDEVSSTSTTFRVQDVALPSLNSPYSKQQLWVDYQESHRRCWEAATRNPVGKRIVKIVPQFVLGRGLKGRIDSPEYQAAWDDFWKRNGMQLRIKQLLRELMTYGEIFLRYFRRPEGLVVRAPDPSTIWDIITDPDDIENIKYYHQQYVILNTSPVVGIRSLAPPSTLIIRQIPADEIDHFKINATHSEKRGRSELFPILGWLLRFKEFANDRVLLNKMRAMFALDVKVTGDAAEVSAAEAQFATPPGPGAVLIHNETIETDFKNANTNANEAKTDAEMLLKIIAIGAGISEQFLGVASAQTRAGALIQTEPDVKNFEDYQEIVEDMLQKAWTRVAKAKRLPEIDKVFEVSFPSLASEDRSAKLKDLAMAEAMEWFTAERAAAMAAKEFNVSTYDYDREQEAIRQERGKDPVIMQGFQSVPKIMPDPLAEPPALAGAGEKPGSPTKAPKTGWDEQIVTQPSAQMGFSAKKLSGRNLADTKPTLNRSGFTRSGEKLSIKNRRSAGAPIRASMAGPRRPGWGDLARVTSLLSRLRIKQRRLEERLGQQPVAQPPDPTILRETETLKTRIVTLEGDLAKLREVKVEPPPAPIIHVAPAVAEPVRKALVKKRIERDGEGRIVSIVEEPIE